MDQAKDNYEVLKGEQLTVVFKDVNGKEVARQKQRANDYGSFAGSFTAPRDRLMGADVASRSKGGRRALAHFRVEEYKRPKFEVTLDAPKTAAKLNEKVSLTGHAMNYTGAAVDGAAVKYRIVREVRMPWWWGWWRGGWPRSQSQEIAHGTATTGTDGSFKIEFTAKPDPKVPEKDEPTFVFQINADVTDSAGETRSADRAIRVGYTALEAMLSADDWQTEATPVELKLETKTLDGEPQVAEGSVKVYELQAPDRVHRPPHGSVRVPGAVLTRPTSPTPCRPGPLQPEQLAAGQGSRGKGLHHRHEWSRQALVQAGRGRLPRGAGDAGPVRQESHRQAPLAGAATGGYEAGHQDSATAGRAGLGDPAGPGVHGVVGDGLRNGAGVHRDRAAARNGAALLDEGRRKPSNRSSSP